MPYESKEKTAISVLLATLEFLYEEITNVRYAYGGWPSALNMEDLVLEREPRLTEEQLREWLGRLAKSIEETFSSEAVGPFIHL